MIMWTNRPAVVGEIVTKLIVFGVVYNQPAVIKRIATPEEYWAQPEVQERHVPPYIPDGATFVEVITD